MFKKIEMWVLYLVLLISVIFAILVGSIVKQEHIDENKLLKSNDLGWISETVLFLAEIPSNLKKIYRENSVSRKIPYKNNFRGTPNSEESYLLLSRYDGDLEEGVVELIDLTNFNVVHTWNPDIDRFIELVEQVDEFEFLTRDQNNSRLTLKHPKLTNDGGLLFNSGPLRKINSCSKLVFQNTHDYFHHSIETDKDGNIWVPSVLYPHSLPIAMVGNELKDFRDDAIVKLSPDGKIMFEKSVSKILIENGLEYLLFSTGDLVFTKDPIHLNDIQPVNFNSDYWRKGDVFLSLRNQSMVILYRPSTNKIIWKFTGPISHQHDVDILDDHRISIFDNNAKNYNAGHKVDGHNAVIIYDFRTDKHSSYLQDSLVSRNVKTSNRGRSEILPNGDLFIEDTNTGRTFYFNKDGSFRWRHLNTMGKVRDKVGWSRILYKKEDLKNVSKFLMKKDKCNE